MGSQILMKIGMRRGCANDVNGIRQSLGRLSELAINFVRIYSFIACQKQARFMEKGFLMAV